MGDNNGYDLIIKQLDRIEMKQDSTDKRMEEFNMALHDVTKKCEIVLPIEKIRVIVNEEITKSGPFNFGISKKQMAAFLTALTGFLSVLITIATLVINACNK